MSKLFGYSAMTSYSRTDISTYKTNNYTVIGQIMEASTKQAEHMLQDLWGVRGPAKK